MKNLIFISSILIILLKTGNVLSDNNIFNVNNIEIKNEASKNNEIQVNKAFQRAFDQLINRLLLKKDYLRFRDINLDQVKQLVSYYQIINPDRKNKDNKKVSVNVYFDRERVHRFFYDNDILYSDIIDTEVILFPLLNIKKKNYIYTQNYFFENWNNEKSNYLIQYTLPVENIESIQKINLNKDNLYELDVSDFFKEYENNNIVFAIIEIKKGSSKIFLKTKIQGKKINKAMYLEQKKRKSDEDFFKEIILEMNDLINDLIKSQNLIDVRTPSFLNVKINLTKKNNLIAFNKRIEDIDLIDNTYVQELNKDYVLVKIKYLGKINKLITTLKEKKINLIMTEGQWHLSIT